MKFRSSILFLCMAVVPLVAMFSHKVPREWRLAVQRLARGAEPAAKPAPQPAALVPIAPAAEVAMAAAPVPTPPSVPREPVDAARAGGSMKDSSSLEDRASIEDRLRALGAVSIECVPMMQGTSHRCSCRVPADPSGQLQRVFQSSNPDPVVALRNLHGQVQFWKHRLATRPDVDNPLRTSGDGRQPGLR